MMAQAAQDGTKVEVARKSAGYRGEWPAREVHDGKVLLCQVLHRFGDLSQVQIAQLMNLDPPTVGGYVGEILPAFAEPKDPDDDARGLASSPLVRRWRESLS